jgi:hypothetical protein
MDETKRQLMALIDDDRDRLITFLSQFVQAESPNPPGDTRQAAAQQTAPAHHIERPSRRVLYIKVTHGALHLPQMKHRAA